MQRLPGAAVFLFLLPEPTPSSGGSFNQMDSDDRKTRVDPETILFTLDQLTQTVDVMNRVITKLRGYVQQNMEAEKQRELDFGNTDMRAKLGSSGLH